ncbi:MAG: zinc carboxypeptidase, partial [Ilumatobacteraceae bacterium]
PEEFPLFAGSAVIDYLGAAGTVRAVEGLLAAVANHADESYMRLGRTFDLASINADQTPTFQAQMAWSAEEGYDHVIVEARTVGQENWTTLPELSGQTTSAIPLDCEQGFYIGLHPNLSKYLTPGDPCTTPGSAIPGEWHAFTGESGGWVPVAFDLSAYANQQVEIIISYVTDPVTGGAGVAIDDTRLTFNGGADVVDAEGFEGGLGAWLVLGPPEGSADNPRDWEVAEQLGDITAGVATEDSLLLGFGIEQLESPDARAELVGDALALLGGSG